MPDGIEPGPAPKASGEPGLADGQRVGRFVVMRDIDGRLHAVGAGSVAVVGQTDDGSLLMLPAGRLLHVPQPLWRVLAWLDGMGPRARD